MVIKMIKEFRGEIDDLSENLSKEILSIKKNRKIIKKSEIKNTVYEMNKTLERNKNQTNGAEEARGEYNRKHPIRK